MEQQSTEHPGMWVSEISGPLSPSVSPAMTESSFPCILASALSVTLNSCVWWFDDILQVSWLQRFSPRRTAIHFIFLIFLLDLPSIFLSNQGVMHASRTPTHWAAEDLDLASKFLNPGIRCGHYHSLSVQDWVSNLRFCVCQAGTLPRFIF